MSEEAAAPEEDQIVEKIPDCSNHENEQIRFWCEDCTEKLCNSCFENEHEGHKIQSLKNFLKKQMTKLNEEVSDLSSGLDKVFIKCQEHIDACEEFKTTLSAEREKVSKYSKNLGKALEDDYFDLPLAYKLWTEKEEVVDSAEGSVDEAKAKVSNRVKVTFLCQLFFNGGKWRGGTNISHGKNIFHVECKEMSSFAEVMGDDSPHAKEHCNCRDLELEISWGDKNFNDRDFHMTGDITIEGHRRFRRIEFEGGCKNWRSVVVHKSIPTHDGDGSNFVEEIFPGQFGMNLGIELNFYDK